MANQTLERRLVKPVHHNVYPLISPEGGLRDAAKGRVVLVTGAGSGIGEAIAKAFAAASAPHVILVGRRLEKLDQVKEHISREFTSCKVHCFSADVSNASSVEKMFDEILANGLQVDVLINNAGINDARTPIADSNPDNWWRNYEVMVKGPFVCTRAFFRQRKSITTSGAVIMVSSVGSYATLPNASSYGSAKAALNRFTEWVGVEGKDHNIHAVAFHPGGVAGTELTSSSPEHLQRLFTENVSLPACTSVFLASERAAWLTGRYVDCRWDMEELETLKDEIQMDDLLKMSLLGDRRLSR